MIIIVSNISALPYFVSISMLRLFFVLTKAWFQLHYDDN